MSWLSGWSYRRAITITEQSGGTLTDYQVRIELNSSNFDFSKANSDGSDIRFTEDDGETLLPYWIEKWDNVNEEAIIWVKVPSIPANSDVTIYMYYGNSEAVSESDGEAVFEFFDDFKGTGLDTNKWLIKKGNASATVAVVDDAGTSSVLLDPVDNTDNAAAIVSTASFTNDIVIELRRKFTHEYYVDVGLLTTQDIDATVWHIAKSTANIGYAFEMHSPVSGESQNDVFLRRQDGSERIFLAIVQGGGLTSLNAYHFDRIIYKKDGTLAWEHTPSTGEPGWSIQVTDTTYLNDAKYLVLWQGEYSNGDGGESYIDWVRVRKYAEQEPTATVGSEETLIKAWDGSQWKSIKAVYYWDGSQWVEALGVYYWNGTQWIRIF